MKKLFATTLLSTAVAFSAQAQDVTGTIHANQGTQKINKEIYGQFAEHLGSCIYGGLWVGPDSKIPNTQGYRNDVLQALKDLKVPVLRWPGGCFADEYHWMDGIGPREKRPKMQNNNWGGTIEDNSFGTHEFLNLCEMLGCEPYIRRQNGRDKAWKVKYLGVGNESWGCGGNMRPEYYSDLFRRYSVYCRNYDGNQLYKIASGASDYDYNWTKVLMDRIGNRANAISLHYYTVTGWSGSKGSATKFNNEDYYWTMGKALGIEDVIKKHEAIMDKADPKKQVALLVDEWGTWWDEEPGTIKGHLYQQNCMRDAFVAALSLNVFHRHTERVNMTNIAQIVNVLQSMILTDTKGTGHMVLTPTYHVFNMYKDFQEATYLPMDVKCDSMDVRGDDHAKDGRKIPLVSTSAAKKADGTIVVALANVSLDKAQQVEFNLDGAAAPKTVTGQILSCNKVSDYNDFAHPDVVKPAVFKDAKVKKNTLKVKIPAKSIVVLKIK